MKRIFLISSLLLSLLGYSQENNQVKSNLVKDLIQVDSTYSLMNNYLVQNNWVDKDENYPFYLFNLISYKEFDLSGSYGIYVFGIKYSDPLYCLIFINFDKTYCFVPDNSLSVILEQLTHFYKYNSITNKKKQLTITLSLLKYFNAYNRYLLDDKVLPHKWDINNK